MSKILEKIGPFIKGSVSKSIVPSQIALI